MAGKTKAVRVQHGALPYRIGPDGAVQILLVTSRQTRRWIIPKGWPIKGLKPSKSAAREAFEEAGVRGAVGSKAIGSFVYDKGLEDGVSVSCEVGVFPLKVERQHKTWPEAHQRETRWVGPEEALDLLDDRGLRDVVAAFVRRMEARQAAE
ncbi:MAG: NUDIX hydrolase [Inquilinus limosus]|uniref:NUDIX hydrolase n=1 Tax=Inquilinus limosus TaxID=171674 RepID=A0A952FM87_9PROT|nr:NUDIX hydrolase [Inquilinus limosus]